MNARIRGLGVVLAAIVIGGFGGTPASDADRIHTAGVEAHLERNLGAATVMYDAALRLETPRYASATELARARAAAPRVFTTASEPFTLRDVAAIIHPDSRIIAFHLFWDDDIDFPDDNDPCDHEVVWVRTSGQTGIVEDVWTYFHGRILRHRISSGAAEAARIEVQWGKHGSLPPGWREMTIVPKVTEVIDGIPASLTAIPLTDYLEGSFRKLSTLGRRKTDHPIAARLGWPERFSGTREDFLSFTKEVDLAGRLAASNVLVSRFNSGLLARWILPYNFRPKTEWPEAE